MKTVSNTVSIDGMKGDYSRFALTQHQAIQQGLEKAIETLVLPLSRSLDKNSFHIADLGTADGVNGFPVIRRFAETLVKRQNNTRPQLSVSHIDVPTADFKSLVNNIYNHCDSYYSALQPDIEVQPRILPGSFYTSFIDPESADIIFATTSLHYASTSANVLTNHVDPLYAEGEAKTAWKELSRSDLDTLMCQVHRGLRPGGKFWAIVPAHTRDEKSGEVKNHWNREVWKIMNSQFSELVEKGELKTLEWENFVIPVHQRHVDDWQQWFLLNPDKFQLEYAETVESSNPYLDQFQNQHQNEEQFAHDYIGWVRSWAEHIVGKLIPEQTKRDEFFNRLRQQFAINPVRFADDNVSVYIGATRL